MSGRYKNLTRRSIAPQDLVAWLSSRMIAYLTGLAVAGSGFFTVAGAIAISHGSHIAVWGTIISAVILVSGSVALISKILPGRQAWLIRQKVKSVLDFTVALTMFTVLFPVLILIFLIVISDGGPALFGHMRVGRHGKEFRILKFRTMVPEPAKILQAYLRSDVAAQREWGVNRKLRRDPRLTSIGAFLRATTLDELPQLINVLRGEMSLVGPRPLREDEVSPYGWNFKYYVTVKPGITGLWQIDPDRFATYESRVILDAQYILGWNLGRDILILLKTLPSITFRIARRTPEGLRAQHDQYLWIKHHLHNPA